MNYRVFGKTGFKASEVSLGTWQLGSKWGDPFDEQVAMIHCRLHTNKG